MTSTLRTAATSAARDNSVYEVVEEKELTEADRNAGVISDQFAEAYRLRWLIELFFRIFKQMLGCRHLLSTKQNSVEIQTYIAIIACLLILMHTGRAPTKRTYEMICVYMSGCASLEELERHIEKLRVPKSKLPAPPNPLPHQVLRRRDLI